MPRIDNYPLTTQFTANPYTGFPSGVVSRGFPYGGEIFIIPTAQLLTLQTTAVNIVPAQGAGQVLIPLGLTLQYQFLTTAFTIGNADNFFRVQYTGKATALFPTSGAGSALATGLVNQVVDTFLTVQPLNAGAIAATNCANLGLEIQLGGTTPALTLGLGALIVELRYTIVIQNVHN